MGFKIRHLCLIGLFISTAKAQPIADFSAQQVSGCAPLIVQFADQSSGNPNTWKWDMGNGTSSILQNPSVTYFNPGTYTVTLTVSNNQGLTTITRQAYITVYAAPEVNFAASDSSGCYPLQIQFSDSSQAAHNNRITSWIWDFGDGKFSQLQNPSHSYDTSGSYNVSLKVISTNGCQSSITKNHFIKIFDGIQADFEETVPGTCVPPAMLTFRDKTVSTTAYDIHWNFGDGNSSIESNPTHTYGSNGIYNVTLVVTNIYGCKDSITKNGLVKLGRFEADFSLQGPACINQPVTLINLSKPVPSANRWDFGNGITDSSLNGSTQYSAAGSYQVRLISDFGGCADTVSKTVKIYSKPVARFSTDDTASCNIPFNVSFQNLSTGGSQYTWTLTNIDTSFRVAQNTIINKAGKYSVKLVATSNFGCQDSVEKSEYIKIKLPEAFIKNMPQNGCAPFHWNFSSTINSTEPVNSYLWDFGDGQYSTEASPEHVFDSGVYTVKLFIETIGGCKDTSTYVRAIRVGKIPVVDFNASPLVACAKIPVAFSENVKDSITRWIWKFGDGGTASEPNPNYLYQDTGIFDVTLIAFNNGCSDTLIKEDYITILPPIARAEVEKNCNQKYKRMFRGENSIKADTYHWDFGDGNTSNQKNITHTYSQPGNYQVKLKVTNNITGCDHETSLLVRVIDEKADFEIMQGEICKNKIATFKSKGFDAANISGYLWDAGDGGSGDSSVLLHKYATSGTYQVKLMITDLNGCQDSIVKTNAIRVNGPIAAFTPEDAIVCYLSPAVMIDQSTDDGMHPIVSWTFNFGDNNTKTYLAAPFVYTYPKAAVYDITLTVKDNAGCTDTITKNNVIRIPRPVAAFGNAAQNNCPGNTIYFLNKSTGTGLRYKWDFGDDNSSTITNPTHAYQTAGDYSVTLRVNDIYGCSDSVTRVDYVKIHQVISRFSMSDSVGSCPPLIVSFTNMSTSSIRQIWDFGDGTASQLLNPSHFYATPGVYTVKLSAFTYGNCESTFEKTIIVKGPKGEFTYTPLTACSPLKVDFKATTENRKMIIWDFNDGSTLTTTDSVISHTYTEPGKYLPRIILSSADGCKVTYYGKDSIFVKGTIINASFQNNIICDSGLVKFNNYSTSPESNIQFRWEFGDGTISYNFQPKHLFNKPGTYYTSLTASSPAGCKDSMKFIKPIYVSSSPKPVIAPVGNGCVPLVTDLISSSPVPDSTMIKWTWNLGDGRTINAKDSNNVVYPVAGDYWIKLTAINGFGCSDSAKTLIKAFGLPDVSAGNDNINCYRKGIRLNASGAAKYQWQSTSSLNCLDCSNPIANPDSAETFIVTGFSSEGCIDKDSIHLDVVYPFNMTVSNADTLCEGETVMLRAMGADEYRWSPEVRSLSQNNALVTVAPNKTVRYQVTGKDRFNCFSQSLEIPITVFPVPEVDAGKDVTMNVGGSVKLTPKISADVTEVTWSPTDQMMRSEYPSITVRPRQTTTYTVEVSNPGKCYAKDEVNVIVTCDGNNVFVPNTFSPNGDGMNDVFYPRGTGLFRIKSMKLFNRWGQMVFQKNEISANDVNAGWNGTLSGQPLSSDVYVYVIEVLCDNNTSMILKGDVTLLR
jgi:gliding motility-associated-like protein